MSKIVTIINGYGACGKDTFVKLFHKVLPVTSDMKNISTVDGVKEISKMMGWDGKSKTEKDRQLWSSIKTAWTIYNDGIFNTIVKNIEESSEDFYFVHCREPHEIQKFVDYYVFDRQINTESIICTTLLVLRSGIKPPNNPSDLSVMDYNYDHVITNDGTLEDLFKNAKNYYESLMKAHV